MINDEKRNAVMTLYNEGRKKKEIAKILHINVKSVRNILFRKPRSHSERKDKKTVDPDLLQQLYVSCNGYMQRMHEKLTEEYHIKMGYSTLRRIIHEKGIGEETAERSPHLVVLPGVEMQHDTSPYTIPIAGKNTRVIASGLYLRYSKMRYVVLYPYFTRFRMKCFFHEALSFWKYAAGRCVIDNTNLAVLHGTGKNAIFVPEMESFGRSHGFEWYAHERGCPNRKAGKERNFFTLETNFFPGRSFSSWEDLNRQVFQWATDRYAKRPLSHTKLIPLELFEEEKKHLKPLPEFIEPPYELHQRIVDAYGYIAFQGNYYWVPETKSPHQAVSLLEYARKVRIFQDQENYTEYLLPAHGTKNQYFIPDTGSVPKNKPKDYSFQRSYKEEEKKLRLKSQAMNDYLDWILSLKTLYKKYKFISELYQLTQKMSDRLLNELIERAIQYNVSSMEVVHNMAAWMIKTKCAAIPESSAYLTDFKDRPAYQNGRFSEEANIEQYQQLMRENTE